MKDPADQFTLELPEMGVVHAAQQNTNTQQAQPPVEDVVVSTTQKLKQDA